MCVIASKGLSSDCLVLFDICPPVESVCDTCLSARWMRVPPFAPRATRSRHQLRQHLRLYGGCVVSRGAHAAVPRLLRPVGQGRCHVRGGRGGRTQQVSERMNHLMLNRLEYSMWSSNTTNTRSRGHTIPWLTPHLIQAQSYPFVYIIQPLLFVDLKIFSLNFSVRTIGYDIKLLLESNTQLEEEK